MVVFLETPDPARCFEEGRRFIAEEVPERKLHPWGEGAAVAGVAAAELFGKECQAFEFLTEAKVV